MRHFCAQNGQFAASKNFFFLSFTPVYIPKMKARYQPINEILTIKEYWSLIGLEPVLAINWEPDFLQACSFCRMLMNHKNLCFTPISEKNDDLVFLKSPKTLILDHILVTILKLHHLISRLESKDILLIFMTWSKALTILETTWTHKKISFNINFTSK